MTFDAIKQELTLTAISAATLVAGADTVEEREQLEDHFRDTFVRERELAEQHARALRQVA